MRSLKPFFALLLLFLSTAPLASKDSWDEPFGNWTRNQVVKMLNDSPWAQTQVYSTELGGQGPGIEGEKEIHNSFTVRLFSALPVREAYVRMLQIMNNYDSLPAERREAFDSRVNGLLRVDVHDEVVIAVAFASNNSDASFNLKRFFDSASAQTLNQLAYLYSPRLGRLDLLKYFPPGQEGIGARFIFPRIVNGQPVLQSGDKEMRFELFVPPINQRVLIGFKVSKLVYKGEMTY